MEERDGNNSIHLPKMKLPLHTGFLCQSPSSSLYYKKQEKLHRTNCLIFCLSYRTNTHAQPIAYLGPQATENFHTFSFAPFATLCHKNKLK